MSIEWFRDLVICIFGIIAAVSLIFIAVVAFSTYRQLKSTMDSLKTTSKYIEGMTSRVESGVVKPVIEIVTVIKGIRQVIETLNKIFKKK